MDNNTKLKITSITLQILVFTITIFVSATQYSDNIQIKTNETTLKNSTHKTIITVYEIRPSTFTDKTVWWLTSILLGLVCGGVVALWIWPVKKY